MALQIEADLPAELAGLKDVDALLRCPICFDFLNISMMTKCSHNFCSLCIRKFLSYKLQCPLCNTQTTEQDLRNNRLLDDLVATFKATRQQLSKATFDSPPISPKTPASAVKCRTPKERGQKCTSSVLNHFFQKRPKASPAKESQHDSSVAQRVQRGEMQTARTHNANDADLHSAAAQLPVVVKEEPMDVKVASIHSLMSAKQEDTGEHTNSSWDEKAHSSSPPQDVKPVIKVDCPVCSVGVSQQFINKHLDACLSRGEKKESLRSSLGKARLQGSRDQLIKRHQEFVHRYNAQCDSLNPKSAEDIAKELEANEKIRNQLQGKTKPVMVFSKNQSEKEIDEMHSNYRKQHSSDFSRLIAQVRGRLETSSRQTRIKQDVIVEGKDAPKTHCAVAESQSCFVMNDVSISSSVSDIFGPEPAVTFEDTPRTPVHKRTSSSRGDDAASPPVLGKRRRKK
ncbi:E3 ubiquitin-protein ligase RAD18 [Larimichthys crocea]|uniref:RING-type E3 ubiquitin transferase n=1 Tax=Larimichthys crocea TaxID=215358 RepID=A0A6G0J4A1_LARCR|nr:E3 ubiquitin-protein ligase RAD18 [Larimichthys crocea]